MNTSDPEDLLVLQREVDELATAHRSLQAAHGRLHARAQRRVSTGVVAAFTVLGIVLGVALGLQLIPRAQARPAEPSSDLRRIEPRPRPLRPAALRQPAAVIVQGVDAERHASLEAELVRMQEALAVERDRIRGLTEQLLRREREYLAAQRTPAEILASTVPPVTEPEPAQAPAAAPDPWLPVCNDLLALDGYQSLRFEAGTRVAGKPELADVVVWEWSQDGIIYAVLKAERARFELHRMTETLVVRFYDGHRTAGGIRLPLPADGARLDFPGVRAAAWLEHFPELEYDAGPEPTPQERAAADVVRRALDALLRHQGVHGYYRLASLGAVEARQLRFVQLQWYDAGGALLKTFDADTLELVLHQNGTVELALRNGAIQEGFLRRPFSSDQFRLYLTQQPLEDWRRSGAPFQEAGS